MYIMNLPRRHVNMEEVPSVNGVNFTGQMGGNEKTGTGYYNIVKYTYITGKLEI